MGERRTRRNLVPFTKILGSFRRHPLAAFFVLSYGITWPAWALEKAGVGLAAFPGYFGPAIAAFMVAAASGGRDGVRDLLARLFRWRVRLRWYATAVLLGGGSVAAAIAIRWVILGGGQAVDWGGLAGLLPRLALVAAGLSLYGTLVVAGEEIGWRGFALPLLLERRGPLAASVIVGVFWGLWHLPLSFLHPSPGANLLDAALYGLGVDFASVIYTWLFRRTRGSVPIASLFHAVYDVALVVLGPLGEEWIGAGPLFRTWVLVLGVVAVVIVVVGQREWLAGPATSLNDPIGR